MTPARSEAVPLARVRAVPWSAAVIPARPTPWARRFTLAAMFVYVGKIADLYPQLAPYGLGKIFIALALLSLLFEGGGWHRGVLQNPLVRPFLAIAALAVVTMPFAIWPGNSFRYLTEVMLKDLVFTFLLIATTQTQRDLRHALWAFVFSAMVLDSGLLHYGSTTVSRVFVGRNEIAMYSVIALALLLPMRPLGIGRLVRWASIAVIATSIFASHSRGSYLGMAVVVAAYIYFRLGRRFALASVVFMAVAYAVYVQLPSDYRGSVDSIINYEQDYNVTAQEGRLEVWKRGVTMVVNDPLTGVGISNFAVAEGMMHAHVRGQPWLTAHNSPLQVAGEIGLAGLVLYLVLVVRLFKTAKRISAEESEMTRMLGLSLLLAMIAYAVTGSFLSQGFSVVFYALIAFVLVADRAPRETDAGPGTGGRPPARK